MENCGGQGSWCLCFTRLAHSCLVSQGLGHVHREASSTSTTTEQANSTGIAKRNPPLVTNVETSGMSIIRTKIERYNISDTAKDVFIASWREGSKKQYCTYLGKWKRFCAERNINWLNATVEQGIGFLAQLFEQKISYSAINTARLALTVKRLQVVRHLVRTDW